MLTSTVENPRHKQDEQKFGTKSWSNDEINSNNHLQFVNDIKRFSLVHIKFDKSKYMECRCKTCTFTLPF